MRFIAGLILAPLAAAILPLPASPQQAAWSRPANASCGKEHKLFGSYTSISGRASSYSVIAVFCSARSTAATRPGETRIVISFSSTRGMVWADSDTCPVLREVLTAVSKTEPNSQKIVDGPIVVTADGTDVELFLHLPLPGDTGEARTLDLKEGDGQPPPHAPGWEGNISRAMRTMDQKLEPCWQLAAPP